MGFLVSAVILLIFDLDRPGSGFIRNDQQSMIDVAANKTLVERLVTSGHVIIDAIHRNRAMDLHRLSRCCALTHPFGTMTADICRDRKAASTEAQPLGRKPRRTVHGTNLTPCSVVLFAAGSQGSLGRF
jgi:hypothetical protein